MTADYIRQPKTAVIEGLSFALSSIASDREEKGLPELNITDEEIDLIEKEIAFYVTRRFNLQYKD